MKSNFLGFMFLTDFSYSVELIIFYRIVPFSEGFLEGMFDFFLSQFSGFNYKPKFQKKVSQCVKCK